MSVKVPADHTVVLKGLSNNVVPLQVDKFVKSVTPTVLKIYVTHDQFPTTATHGMIAFLAFLTTGEAQNAKKALQDAVRARKEKESMDFSNVVVYIRHESRVHPTFAGKQITFAIRVTNIVDESHEELKSIFSTYGALCSTVLHGVPPIKLFEDIPRRSAIVNFVRLEDAQTVLDACASQCLYFGNDESNKLPAIAEPYRNTRFVLNTIQKLQAQPGQPATFKQIDQIASIMGYQRPDNCIDLLQKCSDIFNVNLVCEHVTLKSEVAAEPASSADSSSQPSPSSRDKTSSAGSSHSKGAQHNAAQASRKPAAAGRGGNTSNGSRSGGGGGGGAPPPQPVSEWSVEQVQAALDGACGYGSGGGAVTGRVATENGVDGKTLLELLGDEEGRALMLQPVIDGGMGLRPLHLRRLQADVKVAGLAAAAAAAAMPDAFLQDQASAAAAAAMAAAGGWMGIGGGMGGEDDSDTRDPITFEVMCDPVLAADGVTYDRATIEDWLSADRAGGGGGAGALSPCTGAPLGSTVLIPNASVRSLIARLYPALRLRPWRL